MVKKEVNLTSDDLSRRIGSSMLEENDKVTDEGIQVVKALGLRAASTPGDRARPPRRSSPASNNNTYPRLRFSKDASPL